MERSGAVRVALVALGLALLGGTVRTVTLRLKYVAIVTRHGVRAPTWTAERLNRHSAAPWPDFGVPAGHLTPHGRMLMTRMGGYYREWLASEGLLKRDSCADADRVYIASGEGSR